MSATKILWGQILTVFLIVLATTWGATEWVAWRLAFQPELGAPWLCFIPSPKTSPYKQIKVFAYKSQCVFSPLDRVPDSKGEQWLNVALLNPS